MCFFGAFDPLEIGFTHQLELNWRGKVYLLACFVESFEVGDDFLMVKTLLPHPPQFQPREVG